MNKNEALKMAIEIMQRYLKETPLGNQPHMIAHKAEEAIQACKDALEQPAKEQLTDSQCDEFRRLPVSFNDMVRAIYKAGQEALEQPADGIELEWYCKGWDDAEKDLATQEPFGIWHVGNTEEESDFFLYKDSGDVSCEHCIKLYTTPPSREWVSLSDDEITGVWNSLTETQFDFDFARVIEAKLKEKNELFGNSR